MEKVKKLRKEIGFKQTHLGELLGIHKTTYSQLENCKFIPNNIKEIEERAIKILKPLLVQKLLKAQEEVERLESLIIQYK